MIKVLQGLFIVALTIYGPAELTRLILILTPLPASAIELVFMWGAYLAAMVLVGMMIERRK